MIRCYILLEDIALRYKASEANLESMVYNIHIMYAKTFYWNNMGIYVGKQPPELFMVENRSLDIRQMQREEDFS